MTITEIESHEQLKGAMSSRQGFGFELPIISSYPSGSMDIKETILRVSTGTTALTAILGSAVIGLSRPDSSLADISYCSASTNEQVKPNALDKPYQINGSDLSVDQINLDKNACVGSEVVASSTIWNKGSAKSSAVIVNIFARMDISRNIKKISIDGVEQPIVDINTPHPLPLHYCEKDVVADGLGGQTFTYNCGFETRRDLDPNGSIKVDVTINPDTPTQLSDMTEGPTFSIGVYDNSMPDNPIEDSYTANNTSRRQIRVNYADGNPYTKPNPCVGPILRAKNIKLAPNKWRLEGIVSTTGARIDPKGQGSSVNPFARVGAARVEITIPQSDKVLKYGKSMRRTSAKKIYTDIRRPIDLGITQKFALTYKGSKISLLKGLKLISPGDRLTRGTDACLTPVRVFRARIMK